MGVTTAAADAAPSSPATVIPATVIPATVRRPPRGRGRGRRPARRGCWPRSARAGAARVPRHPPFQALQRSASDAFAASNSPIRPAWASIRRAWLPTSSISSSRASSSGPGTPQADHNPCGQPRKTRSSACRVPECLPFNLQLYEWECRLLISTGNLTALPLARTRLVRTLRPSLPSDVPRNSTPYPPIMER